MRKIHLASVDGRDTVVQFESLKPSAPPRTVGPDGAPVAFRRHLSAAGSGLHEALSLALGPDYGAALVDGDPETDLEVVGRPLGETAQVWLTSEGRIMHAPPHWVEVIFGPDGAEKERKEPADQEANVNDESPVRWTRRRMKRAEVVRRFAMLRTVQIFHVDGLTFDYLRAMAQELDAADEMVLVGAGARGVDPLVFSTNGTPWRAFLEGRVEGEKFKLLLHLSNLELRRPA